jgi:hypothetical protein
MPQQKDNYKFKRLEDSNNQNNQQSLRRKTNIDAYKMFVNVSSMPDILGDFLVLNKDYMEKN